MKIACLGKGSGAAGEHGYDAMVQVGRLLAKAGHTVITGAYGGTGMEAPAKGAKEAGGAPIGCTMLGMKPNQWITQIIDCAAQYHMGFSTPPILEIQFGMRLGCLLAADGFIIAAGGGPGSLVELMAIINLNSKLWKSPKKLGILKTEGREGAGWDAGMLVQLEMWGVLPPKARELIRIVDTPEQAVNWVTG